MEDLVASSPLSWRTAPTTPNTPEVTMRESEEPVLQEPTYRAAKQLPHELRMACKIHLEEKLFANALTLENELLTSPSNPDTPAFVAPISHIALISTLLVHPNYTTRAQDARDRRDMLFKALTYLRNILAIVGPGNAKLNEAFIFRPQSERQRYVGSGKKGGSKKQNSKDSFSDDEDESSDDNINLPVAESDSLWMKAQDFWHVVGWAFNCSVAYPERWEYWKIWLGYMVDVIDADWFERDQKDWDKSEELKQVDANAEEPFDARSDSILSQYISSHRGRSHFKRIMKAIFANGEGKSIKEFPEVFAKETAGPRKEGTSRKRQKFGEVDLENGNFGGYGSSGDDDDDEEAPEEPDLNSSQQEPTPPASSPGGRDAHEAEDDLSMTLGGPESITLRLRLMALLSRASFYMPEGSVPLKDLYDTFAENVRALPLHSLSLFVCTNAIPHFPQPALLTLCQETLAPLIDDNARGPDTDGMDAKTLVECFLPWAACSASIEENAKLSLLIETLLRLYVKEPDIKYESSLEDFSALKDALEKGIKAREAKIKGDNRRKRTKSASNSDDSAKFLLKCSSERMRLMMPVYEKTLMRARSDYESSQSTRY